MLETPSAPNVFSGEGGVMPEVPAWHAKGDWFDVCRCNVPCPCSWAQPPDDDYCEGVLVWHIRDGRYGDVALDGLNVIGIGTFKGNVWTGEHSEPRLGVLLDERADDRQRDALQMIFGGQAGGWPARFTEMFGPEMVGLDFAPIHIEVADDLTSWRAEVPGRVRATASALSGPTSEDGKPPRMHNLPGAETGPGQIATQGKATADEVDSFVFKWNRVGKSSKHITFDWRGPNGG
jgi:hypothetical protein